MADRIVHPGVTIAPAPPAARYSLRARSPHGLPPILSSAPLGDGHALALGPDEWLAILPDGSPPPVVAGPHALVDIGHRDLGIAIDGPAAARLLQCGVALDLAAAAFLAGKVTRTLYEGVEIVLWRTADESWRVEVARAFAEHLRASLALAAADVAG